MAMATGVDASQQPFAVRRAFFEKLASGSDNLDDCLDAHPGGLGEDALPGGLANVAPAHLFQLGRLDDGAHARAGALARAPPNPAQRFVLGRLRPSRR